MATKKKMTISKPSGPKCWEEDEDQYPLKRGVCEHCNQLDDLKLSYDKIRYICLNSHACQLRWIKKIMANKEKM